MKIVGKRQEAEIFPNASAESLRRAAKFNEMLQSTMPNGALGYIPKGVYRFFSNQEANEQQEACLIAHLVRIANAKRP